MSLQERSLPIYCLVWIAEAALVSSLADQKPRVASTLKEARELAVTHVRKAQQKYKHYYDQKTVEREFLVGDWVFVRFPQEESGKGSKLSHPWHGQYRVVNSSDTNVTVGKLYGRNKKEIFVHQSRVIHSPPYLPVGYYWYGPGDRSLGKCPQWIIDCASVQKCRFGERWCG